jgi:CBS domain-containing protein
MKVKDILRGSNRRIVTVPPGETVEAAAQLLKAENVDALVVRDGDARDGTVIGILCDHDIARAVADHGAAASRMTVSMLMEWRLDTCGPGDLLPALLEKMDGCRPRHFPVLDGDHLVGVISPRDLIEAWLCEIRDLHEAYAVIASD